jgi:hypothetical protein
MRHFPEHRELFPQDEGDDPGRVGGRGSGGRSVTHECIDCHDFRGGPLAAFEHHRQHHHRIQVLALQQLARFGCCAMHEPATDDLLIEGGADYHIGFPERTTE